MMEHFFVAKTQLKMNHHLTIYSIQDHYFFACKLDFYAKKRNLAFILGIIHLLFLVLCFAGMHVRVFLIYVDSPGSEQQLAPFFGQFRKTSKHFCKICTAIEQQHESR